MTTQISSTNIQPATLAALAPITITSIAVTNSSWTPLDDSAVSTSGGFIVITGTNFASGCNVIIGNTNAISVAFVNSTTLRVQVPAMSAGTYIVYVVNTSGATAIIVNGLTYSGTPTWVTESPLPSGTTGIPINIQLSATGDTPLIYTLQAGSTLPAGLTLSSSGLLSGTISGLTSETTYNFTIVATDPQLQDSPKAFAITILIGDQFWDFVTLLLPGTTSTSIFNDDASTNNFPVTVFGDTRPNNFGPYTPGYYSNFFDGSTSYLTAPVTAASGDLTIECWIYPTAAPSPRGFIVTSGGNDTTAWGLSYNTNNSIGLWLGGYGGPAVNSTSTIPLNTWGHIAIVKTSGTAFLYVNGVRVSPSVSQAGTFGSANNAFFGTYNAGPNTQSFAGYISNFRYVNGTALYTGTAFTPPTQPLTAVSGTTLLTCQSNRFIDTSASNVTITSFGATRIDGFDPFVPSSSTATLGSTYFDGNGDYLTAPANAAFQLTGDFTLEAWIYPTTINSFNMVFGSENGANSDYLTIRASTLDLAIANASYPSWSQSFVVNRWYHIAVTRSSNTLRAFVNGVALTLSSGSATNSSQMFQSGAGLAVGRYGNTSTPHNFTGYISNARVIKGTALYTAAFTPPTQPLTAVTNTSLLTCQTNQPNTNNMFLDSSTNNFLLSRFGNTTQGTFSPYGENWSVYFSGSSSAITFPSTSAVAFSTQPYTIEGWVNIPAGSNNKQIFNVSGLLVGTGGFGGSTVGALRVFDGTNTFVTSTSYLIATDSWNHFAVVREGTGTNQFKMYVNGTLAFVGTSAANHSAQSGFIGAFNSTSDLLTGYISNLRIVKRAVYTTASTTVGTSVFTPSTTPLQPVSDTSLLTCESPNIVDLSVTNLALTPGSGNSVQKFGPFAGTTLPTPYYSAYFDGSGDFLTVASNTAFNLGAGNFTVEGWYNFNALNIQGQVMFRFGGASAAFNPFMFVWNDGTIYFRSAETSGEIVTPFASGMTTGVWYHWAVVRVGNTYTIYRNGVSVATGTSTAIVNENKEVSIGSALNGHISNFRVVKGQALYTANFTPSTVPLTTTSQGAIASNVSLLTCQSNTFIDNSPNNFAITVSGNSQPRFVNPFTVTYSTLQSYSPSVFGGSMYFDGTGDYLQSSTPFTITTGPFTIEAWVYLGSVGADRMIIDNSVWSIGQNGGYRFYINTSNFIRLEASVGTFNTFPAVITATSSALTTGQWNHVSCTRDSSNVIRLFVNGVSVATPVTYANSLNLATTGGIAGRVGAVISDGGVFNSMNGYISDARVIPGTALYTSNFVPPTAPLTAITNTTFLANGTSAAIYDASAQNDLETLGDSRLVTNITKYGNSSMFFDGTGDYLTALSRPNLGFGTGSFTIEGWCYVTSTGTTYQCIMSIGPPVQIYARSATIEVYFNDSDDTNTYIVNGMTGPAGSVSVNTWFHFAVVRNGTTFTAYVNGVAGTPVTGVSAQVVLSATPMAIGAYSAGSTLLTGYIQDLRITRGIARYTANFIPPTTPFVTN